MDKEEKPNRRPLYKSSYTRQELSRIVIEMQLLERPLSEWDKNAFKGHISKRAKRAAQVRLNRRIEKYNRLQIQKRLVEQELIKLEEKGDKIFVSLTSRGRVEALKDRIVNTEDRLLNGQVCLVSFDIPEHIRNIRWHIRQLLKEAGFEMLHKSLWQSYGDVVTDFSTLIKSLDIQDWVKVFRADPVD